MGLHGVCADFKLYVYALNDIFVSSLMLLCYCARNNDTESVFAAKSKLSLSFFARNHPNFREIVFYDFKKQYHTLHGSKA